MSRLPLIYWLPAILYFGFISFLSGQAPHVENAPTFNHIDKLYHFVEFFFMGVILARDFYSRTVLRGWNAKRWPLYFLVTFVVLGFADEFHQSFNPGREVDVLDCLADFTGGAVGFVFFNLFIRVPRFDSQSLEAFNSWILSDKKRFAPFLVLTSLFMILSVNVLNIKKDVLGSFALLFQSLTFLEWSSFGMIVARACGLWLKSRFGHSVSVGLAFALGVVAIWFYNTLIGQLSPTLLIAQPELFLGISFGVGVLVSELRTWMKNVKREMSVNPAFERESSQRILLAWPVLFLEFAYASFLVVSQNEFGFHLQTANWILIFVLGLFFARAVMWELWWHGPEAQRLVEFIVSVVLLAPLVLVWAIGKWTALLPVLPAKILMGHAALFFVAALLYVLGWKFSQKLIPPSKKPFYVRPQNRVDDDGCCGSK